MEKYLGLNLYLRIFPSFCWSEKKIVKIEHIFFISFSRERKKTTPQCLYPLLTKLILTKKILTSFVC